MRNSTHIVIVVLLICGCVMNASAQDVDLVSIGKFQAGATNVIGGVETYVVECSERTALCTDNLSNVWNFGENLPDVRIRLCELDINVVSFDCVHTMQVNLLVTKNYKDAVVEVQRYFCGRQDVFFDGNFLGSVRGDASGTGIPINVEYVIGTIKKGRRSHTLVITAPDNIFAECSPEGVQVISMNGFAIKGVPRQRH